MDLREQFLIDVKNALAVNYDYNDLQNIVNVIVIELGKYELAEKSGEIAIRDNSNERLLDMYTGILLNEGKAKRTVRAYRDLLERFSTDVGCNLTDVQYLDIESWLAKLYSNTKQTTRNNYRAYLSAFYKWLVKFNIIPRNPMLMVNPIKCPDEEKLSFTDVEIDNIRSGCETLRDRAEIELLLSTGARADELCNITLDNIDFSSGEVRIEHGKGDKGRTVYMNSVACYHLKEYLKTRADDMRALFVTREKTIVNTNVLERDIKRIAKRGMVAKAHPHKFRRTFATIMYKRGMSIRTIQKLLGHANLNTTMRYINASNEFVMNECRKYA